MDNLELLASLGMNVSIPTNSDTKKTKKAETKEIKDNGDDSTKDLETKIEDNKNIKQSIEEETENINKVHYENGELLNEDGTKAETENQTKNDEDNTVETDNKEIEQSNTVETDMSSNNESLSLFASLGMEQLKEKKKEIKTAKTTSAAASKVKTTELEKDKMKIVKVYGQEVMTIAKGENGNSEEIREYLVTTLGFREFQKDDTQMVIINDGEETQYIIPQPKFRPKG